MDKILKVIPRERRTYLYSATMTKKVAKLQRASLHNPVKVEVSTKYQTVEKLHQSYIFIPSKFKVYFPASCSIIIHSTADFAMILCCRIATW